jgi:hypothetical protein
MKHNSEKDRPSAESSHTRWGLGKDYTSQVISLQYNAERLRRTQDLLQYNATLKQRKMCARGHHILAKIFTRENKGPLEVLPTTTSHGELAASDPPTSTGVLSEARTLDHACNDLHQLPPTQKTWRKSSGSARSVME